MTTSFAFEEVESFTAGTVGEPGNRIFYLQVRSGGVVTSFRLEKQQVAALAEHLGRVLADLPATEPAIADMDLAEPVVAEWVVGDMGLGHDEATDRIVVLARELVTDDDPEPDREPASARIAVTLEQAAAFSVHAAELVAAGRPRCRFCGRPEDPGGHMCPRANGHKRE